MEAAEKRKQALTVIQGNTSEVLEPSGLPVSLRHGEQLPARVLTDLEIYELMLPFVSCSSAEDLRTVEKAVELINAILLKEGVFGALPDSMLKVAELLFAGPRQIRLIEKLSTLLELNIARSYQGALSRDAAELLVYFCGWYLSRKGVLEHRRHGSALFNNYESFNVRIMEGIERSGCRGFLIACSGMLHVSGELGSEQCWLRVAFEHGGDPLVPGSGWESWRLGESPLTEQNLFFESQKREAKGVGLWQPVNVENGMCILEQAEMFVPYAAFCPEDTKHPFDCRVMLLHEDLTPLAEWTGDVVAQHSKPPCGAMLSPHARAVWPMAPIRGEALLIQNVDAKTVLKKNSVLVDLSVEFSMDLIERAGEEIFFQVRVYDQDAGLLIDEREVRSFNGAQTRTERFIVPRLVQRVSHSLNLLLDESLLASSGREASIEIVAADKRGEALVGDIYIFAHTQERQIVIPEKLAFSHAFRSSSMLAESRLLKLSSGQNVRPALQVAIDARRSNGQQLCSLILFNELTGERVSLGTELCIAPGGKQKSCFVLPGLCGEWKWVEPEHRGRYVEEGWKALFLRLESPEFGIEEISLPFMTRSSFAVPVAELTESGSPVVLLGGVLRGSASSQTVSLSAFIHAWRSVGGSFETEALQIEVESILLGYNGRPIRGQSSGGAQVSWDVGAQIVESTWKIGRVVAYQHELKLSWDLSLGAFERLSAVELIVKSADGEVLHRIEVARDEASPDDYGRRDLASRFKNSFLSRLFRSA